MPLFVGFGLLVPQNAKRDVFCEKEITNQSKDLADFSESTATERPSVIDYVANNNTTACSHAVPLKMD